MNSIENIENSIKKYNTAIQKKLDGSSAFNINGGSIHMSNIGSINNKNLGSINLFELLSSQLIHNNKSELYLDSFDTNKSPKIMKKSKSSRSLINTINSSINYDTNFKNSIRIFIGTWNMMGRVNI